MSNSNNIERKLAAIMFTDIVGFTALASSNEQYAIELLQKQREIIFPIIEKHDGQLHKELGDGLLVSFNLTSKSIDCAIAIQKTAVNIKNLNLRIGIHEGEIAIGGNDVLGDDVNVASRIEPFSAVGGIAISGRVQQNISSNPRFETDLIAKPNLKGVSQEISVFAITTDGLPLPKKSDIQAKLEKKTSFKKDILLSTFFGITIFFGVFSIFTDSKNINPASLIATPNEHAIFTTQQQQQINQIDSLLLANNINAAEEAFDLASEMELSDTSSIDFRLIKAKTIFSLGVLKENNERLFKKSEAIVISIIEKDFKNYKNQSYGYYILSKIKYFNGNKEKAFQLIKKAFFISKSTPEIKSFWKKLNREQLQDWRLSK